MDAISISPALPGGGGELPLFFSKSINTVFIMSLHPLDLLRNVTCSTNIGYHNEVGVMVITTSRSGILTRTCEERVGRDGHGLCAQQERGE